MLFSEQMKILEDKKLTLRSMIYQLSQKQMSDTQKRFFSSLTGAMNAVEMNLNLSYELSEDNFSLVCSELDKIKSLLEIMEKKLSFLN